MKMPEINERVLQLVDYYSGRSVKKFAESIKIPQQTLNRIFNIDSRTGKFPLVTTEILVSIADMYVEVNVDWLLVGRGDMLLHTNQSQVPVSSSMDDKLLFVIKEKDARLQEQAATIGRLEERVETLTRKGETKRK